MPTPFTHLDLAEQMRSDDRLPDCVRTRLDRQWPAFCLGNVAPDFQTICDVPRVKTHFYALPPRPEVKAHEVMLATYPELANAHALPAGQAAFIAGYGAHLILDLRWYRDVLIPYFLEADDWAASHRYRFLIHNTLLTYLDKQASAALPDTAGATLAAARPENWLPFAQDTDLIRWRDMLADQLRPGATVATIAIYADRLDISPAEFAANLDDPTWMQQHVFAQIPLAVVQDTLTRGMEEGLHFISDYLNCKDPN